MAESSGLQGPDTVLKTLLNQGFEQVRELETRLNFAQGPDFTNFICDYLDRILITFSSVRGLISLNSSASNFKGTENPLENRFGGIEAGHSRKYVKDNRISCSRSPSRSSRPRSRSPSPMGYGSSSNVFGGSVSGYWLGPDKLAERRENECFSRDKERAISRKRKRRYTPTSTRNVSANSSEAGNDIPPEDGYTWRKYGQKEILGDDHPRMYYKCTFHDDRGCKAKKIAQRSNGNPSVIQVRYSEVHSCQRDAQFFKNPFSISEIEADDGGKSPSNWSFTADDGGKSPSNWSLTANDFGKSPSYLPYVDSSAQRAMAFTGHSADQMHKFQGSEKEVSADFIPSPQQNEGPSNYQASLPPCGLSSASGANYMPPTNPRMQTRGFLFDRSETDLSSAFDTNDGFFWEGVHSLLQSLQGIK